MENCTSPARKWSKVLFWGCVPDTPRIPYEDLRRIHLECGGLEVDYRMPRAFRELKKCEKDEVRASLRQFKKYLRDGWTITDASSMENLLKIEDRLTMAARVLLAYRKIRLTGRGPLR